MRSFYKYFASLFLCLMAAGAFAQAPASFNYQAVIRDGSGNLVTSQLIQFRLSIRTGSATGAIQYQETATATSDQYGGVSLAVGTGQVASGTFDGIAWGSGTKFLQTEINLGNGFVDLGASQLVSVPYALEAKHAATATTATSSQDNKWSASGNDIGNSNSGSVGIGTSSPLEKLAVVSGDASVRRSVGTNTSRGYFAIGTTNATYANRWAGMGSFSTSGEDTGDLRFYTAYGAQGMRMRIADDGPVEVVGTLSKGGGSFKIDHPLDPANKFLYHSFVESPDMMNVYNGNITTDATGYATVVLPDYFEALNKDFRYQLTAVGGFSQVYVAEKLQGNQFVIRSSEPNQEISWQITGIRQDNWANQNRIPNTVEKKAEEMGKYLHPEVFGQPAEKAIYPPYKASEATGE